MPKVDYCGKEISENGLRMSTKKIAKVLDFPKPLTAGQMKQFVGLVNYFHDFVPRHSQIVKPLYDMIQNYQKTHVICSTNTSAVHQIQDVP